MHSWRFRNEIECGMDHLAKLVSHQFQSFSFELSRRWAERVNRMHPLSVVMTKNKKRLMKSTIPKWIRETKSSLQLPVSPQLIDTFIFCLANGNYVSLALTAAIGSWIIGTTLGWSSPADSQLKNFSSPNANNSDFGSLTIDPLSTFEFSWVASLLNLGALVGGLSGGALIDLFGRKTVMLMTCVPFIVGWILIITAVSPGKMEKNRSIIIDKWFNWNHFVWSVMLYIGRIVTGLAVGICCVALPTYIGEISIPSNRGVTGTLFTLSLVAGILFASCLGIALYWRWISVICAAFSVPFFVAVWFVPESPYYLAKKGKH